MSTCIEALAEALMALTMALTPRWFEKTSLRALFGAVWATSPWVALAWWAATTPAQSLFGVAFVVAATILALLWCLAVGLTAFVHRTDGQGAALIAGRSRKRPQGEAIPLERGGMPAPSPVHAGRRSG